MTISSRTPEGQPNRCPVCGKSVIIEPSALFGDAPCPGCGTLLWFVARKTDAIYFEHRTAASIQDRIKELFARQLGILPEKLPDEINESTLKALGIDSLNTVELVLMLEEELDNGHSE
ncbi:MAG: hypothetical protein COA78_27315 [Blastopirellula sp.]|nr:MAG: hypothetical protein COA78_27315 [Blastopirellula sp.]